MPIRFHWRLLQSGDDASSSSVGESNGTSLGRPQISEFEAQVAFCREAEELGIDSVLVNVNFSTPDPMVLAMGLASATERLTFMVAHRPGLMSPTLFVQQVNTLSTLAAGRISLNIVAGHSPSEQRFYGDALAHDERYARMREYVTICRRFWAQDGPVNFSGNYYRIVDGRINTPFVSYERNAPEIYIGGGSAAARALAVELGDCWLRLGDTPDKVALEAGPLLSCGREAGLRLCCIVRRTRAEAIHAARALIETEAARRNQVSQSHFVDTSDAQSIRHLYELADSEWLDSCLWAGAVRFFGATCLAMVGTPDEVAAEIERFRQAGISQFILHGWPKLQEMRIFCREVLPRVRALEIQCSAMSGAAN